MTRQRGVRLYLAGACVVILFGVVHMLAIVNAPAPANNTERQLFDLMHSYHRDLLGSNRSTADLVQGFNVSLTLFSLALGGLNVLLVRNLREQPTLLKKLALGNVVWLAAMLANSLLHWFVIPTSFLAVAFACFGAAWVRLTARPAS